VENGPFRERGAFRSIVKYRDIWREPKLFARWQQLCGLSLSVQQQLVQQCTLNDIVAYVLF